MSPQHDPWVDAAVWWIVLIALATLVGTGAAVAYMLAQ